MVAVDKNAELPQDVDRCGESLQDAEDRCLVLCIVVVSKLSLDVVPLLIALISENYALLFQHPCT